MEIMFEYELNREYIYDDDVEVIGETNFVVPAGWLMELFNKEYADEYDSLDDFLDAYEPETDGEFIYKRAIEDNVLIEDFGVVMYEED